jgi:hypothetical protein
VCQLPNLRVKLGADGTEPCSCFETFGFGFGMINFEIGSPGKLDISYRWCLERLGNRESKLLTLPAIPTLAICLDTL